MKTKKTRTIVLSGASGFVGKRLVSRLLDGYSEVRCISRDPDAKLCGLPNPAIAVKADLLDRDALGPIFEGADVAFYLAHSLNESGVLLKSETAAAENFAWAARKAGVRRIIYLGALGTADFDEDSPHIQSRHSVGHVLRRSGVSVTEFRASIVIGNGSMPFEVIRELVERLPFMVTPRWVRMNLQPIAADDVLNYLLLAIDDEGLQSAIYEIGGRDVVTYEQLLRTYERARNLRRLHIQVPVITPRLSSHWLRLVTPARFKMARQIVASAGPDSVVRDRRALVDFPIEPMGIREAIERAVADDSDHRSHLEDPERVSNHERVVEIRKVGTHFVERRRIWVAASPQVCFQAISKLGGEHGWYWGDWLWKLRGMLDRAVGGSGLRRELTSRDGPKLGATLDFWTVEKLEEGRRLTLRADMKLPGSAWLDFQVFEDPRGTRLEQTVVFAARGLTGQLYWAAVRPIHAMVFRNMLRCMAEAAVEAQRSGEQDSGVSEPPGYLADVRSEEVRARLLMTKALGFSVQGPKINSSRKSSGAEEIGLGSRTI